MRTILLLAFLILSMELSAQELGDYLGADETKMVEMFEESPKFTNIERDEDTIFVTYNDKIPTAFIFEEGKLVMQHIFYARDLSNEVVKYVRQFVEMEHLKHYADFNVDPPTFYKLAWEEDMLILTLHE
ncbi:MAG: hypothetical protein R6U65_02180 [Perlabentimonas sp.]